MTWSRYKTNKIDDFTLLLENLALEIAKTAKENKKKYFIGGGLAIEFSQSKMTRNHHDIDFFPLKEDVSWWKDWFQNKDYSISNEATEEGNIIKVRGSQGELMVDMVPSDLNRAQVVNYKGVEIFIDDPQKILNEKVHNVKMGKRLREQDLHDFSILGKDADLGQ